MPIAPATRKKLAHGDQLAPLVRHITLSRAAAPAADSAPAVPGLDVEARTLELSFSSEAPVERWFGQEVLSHATGAADLSRLNDGAPLLFNHDMNDVIGVVEVAAVGKDARGHATVRFARTPRGDEVMGMVADGVLRNVSFMYRVDAYEVEEQAGEPPGDFDDAVYTATRWMAYEISIVSVPADQSVGVGRSRPTEQSAVAVVTSTRGALRPQPQADPAQGTPPQLSQEDTMLHFRRTSVAQAAESTTNAAGGTVQPGRMQYLGTPSAQDFEAATRFDAAAAETDPTKIERRRVDDIVALGRRHGLPMDEVHDMIRRGLSIGEARGEVLEQLLARGQHPVSGPGIGGDLTEKEKKSYRFLRALQAQASGDWSKAGFEREVSRAIAQKGNKESQGFFIPNDLPFAPDEEHLRAWKMMSHQGRVDVRSPYLVGTAAQGGNLVQTQLLYENFVEVLRNQIVTALLGGRYLTGLTGNVDIPRQITQTGTYWVAESGAPTEAEATFDKVSLRPKTVGALSKMSRLMLLQATPAIEMLARQDLLAVIALAIDLAALSGSGASNQPTGIVNQSGVGSVVGGTNGANLTFDHLISLKYATKYANAPQGASAFAMNSKAIGYLSTLKASTGSYLWDPQGGLTANSPDRVKGSPYAESQQLRATLTKGSSSGICSELIYGNWQELFIAMWGVTEIMLNPYDATGFTTGDVLVRAFQTCDIGVRHGASFAIMSDALTPGF